MNIIKLSNDSGLVYYGMGKDRAKFIHHLETFAALVEAEVRANEREECAKVCEPQEAHDDPLTAWKIAKAIRARGTT